MAGAERAAGPSRRLTHHDSARASTTGSTREPTTAGPRWLSSQRAVPPMEGLSPEPKVTARRAFPELATMRGRTTSAAAPAADPTNRHRRTLGASIRSGAATRRANCWESTASAMRMPPPTHRPRSAQAIAAKANPMANRSWGWK